MNVVNKWRKKAFDLSSELIDHETSFSDKIGVINRIIDEIENSLAKSKVMYREANLAKQQIEDENTMIKSRIAIGEKHLNEYSQEKRTAFTILQEITNTMMMRDALNFEIPLLPIQRVINCISSIKQVHIPVSSVFLNEEENSLSVVIKELSSKKSKMLEIQAEISVYSKLENAMKSYCTLLSKWKEIEKNNLQISDNKSGEQELRKKYLSLQKQNRFSLAQEEEKLKKIYEMKQSKLEDLSKRHLKFEEMIQILKQSPEEKLSSAQSAIDEMKKQLMDQRMEIEKRKENIKELKSRVVIELPQNREKKSTNPEIDNIGTVNVVKTLNDLRAKALKLCKTEKKND